MSGSHYREGSLKTAATELAEYNLDLVAEQEVRWEKDNGEPVDNYILF
jgi:hypothetical protein